MGFTWNGEKLDGSAGKDVALFCKKSEEVYQGELVYDTRGVPCLRGYRVVGDSCGNEVILPLQKGDVYAFL